MAFDFKKSYKKIDSGVWKDHESGASFKIIPVNTTSFGLSVGELMTHEDYDMMQKLNPQMDENTSAEEREFKLSQVAEYAKKLPMGKFAKFQAMMTVAQLVDWKNVEADGEDIPFSKEIAMQFCLEVDGFMQALQSIIAEVNQTVGEATTQKKAVTKKK
jgi:hypothetical protein